MVGFGVSAFIFLFCVQWALALQTHVEYSFSFKCGKQPITGELIVQKGGSELLKVDFKRGHQNEFKAVRKYLEFPVGTFSLVLRTGCGALSKIGQLCVHEYTSQPFFQQQGTSKYIVFEDGIDLFSEIQNKSSKIELVCNEMSTRLILE